MQINHGVLVYLDDNEHGPEKLVVILDCRGATALQVSMNLPRHAIAGIVCLLLLLLLLLDNVQHGRHAETWTTAEICIVTACTA